MGGFVREESDLQPRRYEWLGCCIFMVFYYNLDEEKTGVIFARS